MKELKIKYKALLPKLEIAEALEIKMKKENADLSLQADGATDALEGLRNEI